MLTVAVAGTVPLQLATLYVPVLNRVFRTEPLSGVELLYCFAMATVTFVAVAGENFFIRRGLPYADRVERRGGLAA